jgi:hypothetical protein
MVITMMATQLVPGVHWVGAIDWNLREYHGYTLPGTNERSCDRRNGRIPEPCFGGTIITTAVLYPPWCCTG